MPQKRKKILFVDDEVALLDLLRQMMGSFSQGAWDVLTAPDVSKALGILQSERVDLLVIDIHMPLVDGLQFLNLLQRKYPNVLKVVLTGDPSDHYRALCLSNGAELFLEKPRIPHGRLRWIYEEACLHCERRGDGVCLGVFTPPHTKDVDLAGLERFFSEFRTLSSATDL